MTKRDKKSIKNKLDKCITTIGQSEILTHKQRTIKMSKVANTLALIYFKLDNI